MGLLFSLDFLYWPSTHERLELVFLGIIIGAFAIKKSQNDDPKIQSIVYKISEGISEKTRIMPIANNKIIPIFLLN